MSDDASEVHAARKNSAASVQTAASDSKKVTSAALTMQRWRTGPVPVNDKQVGREAGLAGSMIPRTAPRLANLDGVDQRAETRYRGLIDNAVLGARGREKLVRVVDVSAEGAMITPAPALRIGEAVVLRLVGDLEVPGVVRWIRDGRMGLNFTVPLIIQAP